MLTASKQAFDLLAVCLVLPAWACYRVQAAVFGGQRVFPGWSQAFSLVPGHCGVYLRRAFYRLVLRSVGDGAWISFGTIFSHAGAQIGRTVYVGAYCVLGDVTLEDNVLLGSQVSIINGSKQHGIERLDVPVREQPGDWPRVTIGEDTWIGDRAVVMADVGRHCIVGAGAVVIKPVPDYAIVVGNPARIVRFRNEGDDDRPDPGKVESHLQPKGLHEVGSVAE